MSARKTLQDYIDLSREDPECVETLEGLYKYMQAGMATLHTDFSGLDLSHSVISDPSNRDDFGGCNFRKADLTNSELRFANLTLANFEGAILNGASLKSSNCEAARFEDSFMKKTDLSYTTMRRARLDRADLTNADLSCANFSYAVLRGANLTNANLEHSDLKHADLSGAILTGVQFSVYTRMPDGSYWEYNGNTEPVLSDSICKPMLNNDNDVCYFCGAPTVPLFGRKRFCNKCKK
jgi:uncharacterized protein YjbI with pentapeptide repeats